MNDRQLHAVTPTGNAAAGYEMSTVLVVEDVPAAREVVMRILRREGYDVLGAANGIEAIEAIRRNQPDLVLLDIMMPEMDGLTMLSQLRDLPEFKELPVILLTALSDDGRIDKAKELGVREYLVKTRFSYDELLEHVSKYARH